MFLLTKGLLRCTLCKNCVSDFVSVFLKTGCRDTFVFRKFSPVSPYHFEISFRGKMMQFCHLNIKIIVFCLRNMPHKNNLMKNRLRTIGLAIFDYNKLLIQIIRDPIKRQVMYIKKLETRSQLFSFDIFLS